MANKLNHNLHYKTLNLTRILLSNTTTALHRMNKGRILTVMT